MKKKFIIMLSIISLILTLFISEILSIYHIGSIPTILTSLYLIFIFSIFEYINLVGYYIFKNKMNIKLKKIVGLILLFISIILFFLCIIVLEIDYMHMYMYSSPFYLKIIGRCVEFVLPGIISLIIGIILLKKE